MELRPASSQFVSWQYHPAFESRGAYVEEDERADQDHAQCREHPKRRAARVSETEVAEPLEVSVCGRRVGQSQQTESEHGQSARGAEGGRGGGHAGGFAVRIDDLSSVELSSERYHMKTSGRKSLWRSTSNVVLSALMGFGVCAVQAVPLRAEGWKKHVVQEGTNPMTAIAADFTGDGKVDVITNHGGKTWLLVAPDWREIEIDNRPSHSFIHSEVIDVDGDGDMDYIGARYSPGLIVWLENPQRPEIEPWPLHIVDDHVAGNHGELVGAIASDGVPANDQKRAVQQWQLSRFRAGRGLRAVAVVEVVSLRRRWQQVLR